jgi:hypothetical protein
MNPRAWRLIAPALLTALLLLPACAKKPVEKEEFGQAVSGKVTYKGEPVVYGAVLFYRLGANMNPKTGQMVPAASAMIGSDGTYKIANAPIGPIMVCVATDPDANLHSLIRPATMGGGQMGGPPMGGGMPGPPMGGAQPGPPMGGGPPQGGGLPGPPMGGGLPGPPMAGGGPPALPKDAGPKLPPTPGTDKLTEAQKKTLKEIHEKFGTLGKSQLHYVVREGEQTHNIELK